MNYISTQQSLCNYFASIIGGFTILPVTQQSPFCTIGLSQFIPIKMLGRPAINSTMVTDAYFDFENFDSQGRALIIGRIPVLEQNIPAVINALSREGIVYKIVRGYPFSEPTLPIIYVEKIENPITFAMKLIPALKTLPIIPPYYQKTKNNSKIKYLCNQFSEIVGGFLIPVPLQQNFCSIGLSQYHSIKILGRFGTHSPTLTDAIFSFVSLDSQGRALNIGRIPVQEHEVYEFMTMLSKEGILSTLVEGFPHSEPQLPYVYVQQIENPIIFAKKINRAMKNVLR
ncbi:DUF1259 domain-containing protein [Chengkuizengella sediminis]|uniref:DUF1259 domain-containing protein n=1 Tax=Chengkuizengella sediminis TaxID=1885917 RepID=UPI001389974F|nr:DUF1259 domain-containing protein [Chengkuizengella sediminis]NDI35341.1 DUF1259 domain-containing protein [Chengkuizengella sediminis]